MTTFDLVILFVALLVSLVIYGLAMDSLKHIRHNNECLRRRLHEQRATIYDLLRAMRLWGDIDGIPDFTRDGIYNEEITPWKLYRSAFEDMFDSDPGDSMANIVDGPYWLETNTRRMQHGQADRAE